MVVPVYLLGLLLINLGQERFIYISPGNKTHGVFVLGGATEGQRWHPLLKVTYLAVGRAEILTQFPCVWVWGSSFRCSQSPVLSESPILSDTVKVRARWALGALWWG